MKERSLIEVVKSKSSLENVGVTFVNGAKDEDFLSYAELYNSALRILAFLQQEGLEAGDELVLQIDDNKAFVLVFWACILGGIVAIPLTTSHKEDRKKKFYKVCEVLKKPYLITDEKIREGLEKYAHANELTDVYAKVAKNYINIDEILSLEVSGKIVEAQPDGIAFIQFSSGSTGSPKGVVLTHDNLITNIRAIASAAEYSSTDSLLSWMPLTHDMGLIGFHINPLYYGIDHYLIPTNLFVRRPSLWFDKSTEHKASVLCSPNFGYKYIMKHCPALESYDWDLSSVRLIYNGAEPISEQLCHDFIEWGKAFGLRPRAMRPVYGLAEASLAVSISKLEDLIISYQVRRDKLNFGDKVVHCSEEGQAVSFVNVGTSINDCHVAIVDNATNPVEEETIGHIAIKGDNVTSRYYNNPEKTKEVIKKGWLKTGDLGFLKEGRLYITGRDKDIIFINGQNFYPHDIESIAQELDGIELNKIVTVGFFNTHTQVEETAVFIFYRGKLAKFVETALAVRSHINARIGFTVDRVLPVKNIPRTTSGKLQRFMLLQQYIQGEHDKTEKELEALIQAYWKDNMVIVAPQNKHEEKILSIWKNVLNNEQIGVTHRFFEIGGNSLKAAEIIMTVQQAFQVEVPLKVFYDTHTVRELAEKMEQFDKKAYVPIPKIEENDAYEIAPAQQRLFYAWQLDPSSIAYNIPVAFNVDGDLPLKKVKETLRKLTSRHAILRASFQLADTPGYSIKEQVEVPVDYIECEVREVSKILKNLVKPFDLVSDVLMRCAILNVIDERNVLFFDFQHIVMDGLSVQKFIEEFNHLYDGQPLEELRVAYRDYVHWQQNNIEKNTFEKQQKFWTKLYENGVPTLELPIDRPRPALLNTKGKRVKFELNETTSNALKQLAKSNATTLHILMFSMYKWLLAKMTGQTEMVIGIPVSGRTHADLQNVLGMFVNNLPIRTEIHKQESFVDSLKRDVSVMKDCLENQSYPYAMMVDKLVENRDVSRNPLFDTMFLFPPSEIENQTKTYSLSQRFMDPGFSKFDLSLEVFEEGQRLSYVVEYATALFNTNIASYVSTYLERIITQIIADQHIPFSEVSLLSDIGLRDWIDIFNATHITFSESETILDLFAKQVAENPNATVVETYKETFTYQELNAKAEAFKAGLLSKSVIKGDVIAVSLPQSSELLFAILGTLKAGAIYLPIAEETPEERLKFIINDSNSKFLICQEKRKLGSSSCECMTPEAVILSDRDEIAQRVSVVEQDPAYIIYTSGTTGNPKGVLVGHKSIANYVQWASWEYLNEESLDFAFFTSIDFDLTLTSIFLPLISGNKVVIYDVNHDEMPLKRVCTDNRAGIVKLTPSHIKVLLNNKIGVSPSIKKVIVGGEKLTSEIAYDFLELCSHEVVIYNEYGPTEATVGCMVHRFEPFKDRIIVPIGKPIANAKIYILDEFKKLVPKGVTGEIYIAGDCLSIGYINDEDLTNQKFVPNPFIEGKLMYASGDMAKIMPSGIVQYIGRRDEQVKINGHRIEKEEIRQALVTNKGIQDAVVNVVLNEEGLVELYAYYIMDSEAVEKPDGIAIKTWLLDRIPHYMIPKRFIQIEAIPLTRNGKVDTKKLCDLKPEWVTVSPKPISEEISSKIMTVYRTVMGNPDFELQSNFYEFGGDSIKAVQIVSKLCQENIKVSPKEILTYNTPAQLAHFVENNPHKTENALDNYEQGILIGQKENTPIEQWFFDKDFANPNFYNQSVLLEFHQSIHDEVLQQTFQELIIRHDGLRLNVDKKSGKLFFNTKHLESDVQIEQYTLTSKTALSVRCEQLKNTFDLEDTLLIKVAILNLEENQQQFLFVTAHHLVIDGISWRILIDDLYGIYNSMIAGKPAKHDQKTASLPRFESALKQHYDEEKLAQELAYWKRVVQTPFQLPLEGTNTNSTVKDMAHASIEIDQETTIWLLKESTAYNVDIHTILNTVLVRTLANWGKTTQVKIELENHGRHLDDIDVSRTVGWFTIMHPVVFSAEGTLLQNLQSVKETLHNIPEHGLGYGLLKDHIDKAEEIMTPVRFNYLGQFGSELSNDLFSFRQEAIGEESDTANRMTATIEVNAMIISNVLSLQWSYDTKACAEQAIQLLKKQFLSNLNELISELQKSDQPLLTPSDFDDLEISQNELDVLFS